MNLRLTYTQMRILRALVDTYLKTSGYVRSEEVGRAVKKPPSTVRSHLQFLKTLGLIEGVPGPKGGYKPTSKAYEYLLNRAPSEKAVKIFVNGVLRNLSAERIKLSSLSNPSSERAVLSLHQEVTLSESDRIDIIYASQLLIHGKITRVIGRDVIIDVEKLLAIPNKEVATLTHPLVLVDSDTSIKDAASILSNQKAYCAIVFDEGKPIGILTLKHIVKAVAEGRLKCSVNEITDPNLTTVDSNMAIWEVIKLLSRENTEVLITTENGKLTGVVSGKEVMDVLANAVPERFHWQHSNNS